MGQTSQISQTALITFICGVISLVIQSFPEKNQMFFTLFQHQQRQDLCPLKFNPIIICGVKLTQKHTGEIVGEGFGDVFGKIVAKLTGKTAKKLATKAAEKLVEKGAEKVGEKTGQLVGEKIYDKFSTKRAEFPSEAPRAATEGRRGASRPATEDRPPEIKGKEIGKMLAAKPLPSVAASSPPAAPDKNKFQKINNVYADLL